MGSKNNRKGRPSQHAITRSGLRICQKDGQIKALSGDRWGVASQSVNNEWYRVSMSLEAPRANASTTPRGRGAGVSTSRRWSSCCPYHPNPPPAGT